MVDNRSRHPKGDGDGGKYAPEVGSESTVELSSESPVEHAKVMSKYQPDGSKAFEERSGKSKEEKIEALTSAAAFEAEFATRATEPDPWIKREPEPEPEPTLKPIKLGGVVESGEGSWQYPPPPTFDTAKMAAYWSNVLIPDNALQNLENADRSRNLILYEEEWYKFHNNHPIWVNRWKRNHPEEYAAFLAEDTTRANALDRVQFHIGLIPRTELRDVARLSAFWEQARVLGEESVSRAAATEFVTSSGEIVKPLDVVQKYRMWEISNALFNQVRYSRPG